MVNFLRKYILEITSTSGESRTFTDIQLEFQVTKVADSSPNTMILSLYNVNNTTKSLLKKNKDTVVTLKTSYRGGTWNDESDDLPLELVFQGSVFSTQPSTLGSPDIAFTVVCKDGNVPLREARTSSQWPEGVTLKQIINDLVQKHFIRTTVDDTLPITLGEVKGNKAGTQADLLDVKFQNGFSARGPVKKVLDNLLSKNKLQWSVTDGIFNVFPSKATLQETKLVVSGLIGTPEPLFQEPNQLKNSTDIPDPNGVKFKMLLNPKLKPGKRIEMTDDNIKGEYKIEKVIHKGSYFGAIWESLVQAVKVD